VKLSNVYGSEVSWYKHAPMANEKHSLSADCAPDDKNTAPTVVLLPKDDAKPRPPEDYVFASILAAFCCCMPVGIFAILRAMQCRDAIYRERHEDAVKFSQAARRLVIRTIAAGIISQVLLYVLVGAIYGYVIFKVIGNNGRQ
jgi:hypothetical protein